MNSDTHFYLYAKGHYKEEDLKQDLCKIMSERCRISVEYIRIEDIADTLVNLAWKHILLSGNPEHFFSKFVNDCAPYRGLIFINSTINSNIERVIRSCLSTLRFTKVKDLDLGIADDSILEISELQKERIQNDPIS